MHSNFQSPVPSYSPSSPPRQSKVLSQRQYRERESECINTLRDIIKQLTGEDLQTRKEVLEKAIDLLSSLVTARGQEQTSQAVPPVPYEIPETTVSDVADAIVAYSDYPDQPSYSGIPTGQWLPWQNTEADAQSVRYGTQSHGQQFYSMPNADLALEEGSYMEFGDSWSNNHQH